ncbi:UNVERIFIED_CONTAM: Potassium voltage-gated channel subfamily H member 6 [Gekko kuhli]
MKYRTISQIPQFTLNFVEFNLEKHCSGSTTEIEIIAPHKVTERTQNVTEKVTQRSSAAALPRLSLPKEPLAGLGLAGRGVGKIPAWTQIIVDTEVEASFGE